MADFTEEQLKAAAKKAVAAGDIATAKKLIARAQAVAGQQAPATQDPGLAATVAGRTARMGAQGAASVLDIVGNPIKATVSYLTGEPQAPSYRDQISGAMDQMGVPAYENSPTGRIAGAVGEGMTGAGGMAKMSSLAAQGLTGLAGTVAESMGASAGRQVAAGAGAGLGGQGAAEAGVGTAGQVLFGLAGGMAGYGAAGGRPVPRQPKVSVESLRAQKNTAYRAVDDAGITFGPRENAALVDKTKAYLGDTNYLPEVDVQTKAILGKLEGTQAQTLTLGQLDKLRQDAWMRYNKSGEHGIMGIIDAIDEAIAAHPGSNALMQKAREAHSRYKKAELLDMQFNKAELQTAATGSGGNILNKMRQAVSNIMNNPKQAKWFSDVEKAAMEKFVTGNPGQNVLRLIGKLAPTGNGLMTALNLITVAANPMAIAGSGVATAAKVMSDAATRTAGINLINTVAGQAPAAARNSLGGYTGAVSSQLPVLTNLLGR